MEPSELNDGVICGGMNELFSFGLLILLGLSAEVSSVLQF